MKLHIKNVLPIIVTLLLLFLLTGCLSVKTYTVTFDSQGGSAVDSQTVNYGGLVTEPTDPTKEGSTFGGWYKEPECTNAWDFTTDTVISDVTLFAKWMNTVTDIITYKFEADKKWRSIF